MGPLARLQIINEQLKTKRNYSSSHQLRVLRKATKNLKQKVKAKLAKSIGTQFQLKLKI